jgi:hypothetical protein
MAAATVTIMIPADDGGTAAPCRLALLKKPGSRANLDSTLQSLVEASHVQRARMTDKHLAWKVKALPAVLKAPLYSAAFKYGTLAARRLAELVSTATASALRLSSARTTVATTDGRQAPCHALTIRHSLLTHRSTALIT